MPLVISNKNGVCNLRKRSGPKGCNCFKGKLLGNSVDYSTLIYIVKIYFIR